ncbi:bifunctional bis(5'-adenosyl)-triphosphatase/adenylylsulfatase FHIT [Tanacetum coccineum]
MEKLVPWLRRSSAVLRPKATRFHSTRSSILSTPQKVDPNQMFYSTELSFAMMNILPLCPGKFFLHAINLKKEKQNLLTYVGKRCSSRYFPFLYLFGRLDNKSHVLVCPRREVMLFSDLTSEEVSDLRISTEKIGVQVKNYHGASSTTYLIQDGPLAGQTIPHVHIHIIPRVDWDWKDNDRIYDAINENVKELRNTIDYDVQLARCAAAYRRLLSY